MHSDGSIALVRHDQQGEDESPREFGNSSSGETASVWRSEGECCAVRMAPLYNNAAGTPTPSGIRHRGFRVRECRQSERNKKNKLVSFYRRCVSVLGRCIIQESCAEYDCAHSRLWRRNWEVQRQSRAYATRRAGRQRSRRRFNHTNPKTDSVNRLQTNRWIKLSVIQMSHSPQLPPN